MANGVRERLGHPVIDSDGHWIEFQPLGLDYVEQEAGRDIARAFEKACNPFRSLAEMPFELRKDKRVPQVPWWGYPTENVLDRATAMLPKLMYERLDEMGLDFVVLYPSDLALAAPFVREAEVRNAACRALNRYSADCFREYSDRLTPAAVIPMNTPEEAIAALDHAVLEQGLKVAVFATLIRRPVPQVAREAPQYMRYASWLDVLGLDSEYDYDPVWQRCLDLGISPTFHSSAQGRGLRSSLTNMVYNHIGHFGAAGEAICKALFLGGVTKRFPDLTFGFLEGGAGWACRLYADLVGHWDARNAEAIQRIDPARLDLAELSRLVGDYGSPEVRERFANAADWLVEQSQPYAPAQLDDFAAVGIEQPSDLRDRFVPNFYFGCEAEDPLTTWAFADKVNPFSSKLNAMLGTDIGHWDVSDMSGVLEEAYEAVEHGLISAEDFRAFSFGNPARFWGANRDFFKGTILEAEVAAELGQAAQA